MTENDSDNIFEGYAIGTLKEHRPLVDQIRKRYCQQIRESYGFDFYDYSDGEVLIEPILNVKEDVDFGIIIKLANHAILEHNEKEHNVFKNKVLKIEKANVMIEGYEQYFMTVKVLNLSTLGTCIETFYINVARRIPDHFEEILSCNPKGMEPE
ncbi:hypothetical protein R3W88_006969 [Solanum pinnatisectum]|uniref:Cystatin domain-containing protein n=1 Tax=Solanum pinnatisectum TaxID=50273 RepID=A0AAV9KGM4_9SOLN|nr:hypothetical protein R3W88_006969 [Solanum pinnatisectum]